jgi:hypothetical protein
MAPQQKIWHKCKTALPEIAETPFTTSTMAWRPRSNFLSIFIGTGLVIVALLLVFLFNKNPGPYKLEVTPPPQTPLEQFPSASPVPSPAETTPSVPTSPVAQRPGFPPEPVKASPSKIKTPTASPLLHVVNAHYLSLRNGPTLSAPLIATLKRNDEVELLETSGGWGRVQDIRRNIVGWSYMRYLAPVGG